MDSIKLVNHFTAIANPYPVLRAHRGKISELIVHGSGPIPRPNAAMYNTRAKVANHAYLLGQAWYDHVTE